jgi:cold shock CspA family protein
VAALSVARGTVIRFDPIKGYGFIATDTSSEDYFLHVNDLLEDKQLIHAGAVVEFVPAEGDRGMKATMVHLARGGAATGVAPPSEAAVSAPDGLRPAVRPATRVDDSDDLADVLTRAEFQQEVTEILLRVDPPMLSSQILWIREQLATSYDRHGWLSD